MPGRASPFVDLETPEPPGSPGVFQQARVCGAMRPLPLIDDIHNSFVVTSHQRQRWCPSAWLLSYGQSENGGEVRSKACRDYIQDFLRKYSCRIRLLRMIPLDSLEVTDSKVLAAMAHPLRRRLLDLLDLYGPSMVSGLAERANQSVANTSHHLRVLGTAGLIVEAPELANDGRERWWQLSAKTLRWISSDFDHDPPSRLVASAAASVHLERQFDLVRTWQSERRNRPRWDGAAFSVDRWLLMTPAELGKFEEELLALLDRWRDRSVADDEGKREPIFCFAHAIPATP